MPNERELEEKASEALDSALSNLKKIMEGLTMTVILIYLVNI